MNNASLPPAITREIAAKCSGVVSQTMAWSNAALRLSGVADTSESVVEIVRLFQRPRHVEMLAESLAENGERLESFLASLKGQADESDYALTDWIAGFELVQEVLVRSSRNASPTAILGYLHCCSGFGETRTSGQALREVVLAMLSQYGFEGQEGCSV